MENINIFYRDVSQGYSNVLKFILTQNSIRIAIGMALGIGLSNTCLKIINDVIKPLVLITFIIFVIIIYYGIIVPLGKLEKKYNINDNTQQCPYCMSLINSNATKCPSCTSELIKS